uniref:Cell division control protein 42 homolog n=1 Tax=Saccoglossus kowalevskii TaxID=10224 RepID=A0ABM0MQ33_SACKO|nr:PREDICTED: cell division control protein 42 homolog [Saccoglossus kowalevskii]
MYSVKCVVVGDPAAEKTLLLHSFTALIEGKEWPPKYIPTLFEYHAVKMEVDGVTYSLTLWDTTGEEEFGRLRPISYSGADVFLVCFSVSSTRSLQIAKDIWIPEIKKCSPHTPFVLVGTQLETLESESDNKHTQSESPIAKKTGAVGYFECSANGRRGVKAVFTAAVHAAVHAPVWESGGPNRFRQVTRTLGSFLTESYTALRHVDFNLRGICGLLRDMGMTKYMDLNHSRRQGRHQRVSIVSTSSVDSETPLFRNTHHDKYES